MKREELKDTIYSILFRQIDDGSADELIEATEEIAELFTRPPAEGAEEIFTELEFVKLLVDNISGKLDDFEFRKIVNKRANDFATLHAQRIAEKMVEEKLKKEYERGIEDGKIIGEHGSVSYIE